MGRYVNNAMLKKIDKNDKARYFIEVLTFLTPIVVPNLGPDRNVDNFIIPFHKNVSLFEIFAVPTYYREKDFSYIYDVVRHCPNTSAMTH